MLSKHSAFPPLFVYGGGYFLMLGKDWNGVCGSSIALPIVHIFDLRK